MTRRRLTALSGALLCNYMQIALFNFPLISLHPPAPNSIWVPPSSLGLARSARAAGGGMETTTLGNAGEPAPRLRGAIPHLAERMTGVSLA